MKKYLLLTTGGTIACSPSHQGRKPQRNGREILQLAGLDSQADEFDFCPMFSKDSTDLSQPDLEKLLHKIRDAAERYEGILILHGTDTLEYTAALISAVFGDVKIPILLTGAIFPLGYAQSDAPQNLKNSLAFLKRGTEGVFVLFGSKIIPAWRAVKIHTALNDAFEDADKGASKSFPVIPFPQKLRARVFLLKLTPFTTAQDLKFLTEQRYDGCVLSGFGTGGIPERLEKVLYTAAKKA